MAELTPPVVRRRFLGTSAAVAGLAFAAGATALVAGCRRESKEEAEVTPGEDLMQEHGVLERVLLVYEEAIARLVRREAFDLALVGSAAGIVRRFIEEYHEKQEEDSVFPRLEAAHREAELVATLRRQHQRGREVTAEITRLATARGNPTELVAPLRAFVRMYRPHAAREDTVLFPAFRELVGEKAYHELGEQFEDNEHAHFGEHGFEKVLAEVLALETAFGIADLAAFTP